MCCFYCGEIQPIAQNCTNTECGKKLAHYFCGVCKFFDDDEKKYIWHCDKCGLCRVGAREMVHCDLCNMCLHPDHTMHQTYDGNCPICNESLFHSTTTVMRPGPCLHPIHTSCFKQYLRTNYKCPICSKTYKDNFNLPQLWASYQREIDATRMPREYRSWKTEVLCNDCGIQSTAPFHVVGHACAECKGFNTKITALHKIPPVEGEDEDEEEVDVEIEGAIEEVEGDEVMEEGAGEFAIYSDSDESEDYSEDSSIDLSENAENNQ
eukprot:TRINITY_DN3103_c0_g1_i2.p1 TRINITY_DN3103_c0_g1~~TRINITY_DN3103_c0_g1_i2.p1  ORF type:complete len:265 (-),score=44.54 TRINITY_DN3103_c0_g1_i2:28-822(-)